MISSIEPRSPSATRFASRHAKEFARAHWALLAWFAAVSAGRILTTLGVILLVRDFLTGVLSEPHGIAARLTVAVGQPAALWVVVGLLFAVFVAGALCAYGSQLAMQRLVRLFELGLMQRMITHLLRMPVAFFDRRQRADLVESIRQDVSRTRSAAAAFVDMLVRGPPAHERALPAAVGGAAGPAAGGRPGRVPMRSPGNALEPSPRRGGCRSPLSAKFPLWCRASFASS